MTTASVRAGDVPVVSVICAAYNHAPFIGECLDAILAQEAGFAFEVLVHDDASSDGTADVIRAYAARHPDRIRPTLQAVNQFSRGVKPRSLMLARARGRYVAYCDGDDRWSDARKLARQVEFLEAHPEHVLSFHRARVIDSDGMVRGEHHHPEPRDYARHELRTGAFFYIPLSTLVHRRVALEFPLEYRHVLNSDLFLPLLLGRFGGAGYQDDVAPSHTRVHAGAVWSSESARRRARIHAKNYLLMAGFLARTGEWRHAQRLLRRGYWRVRVELG